MTIRPATLRGAAFGAAADGDGREDESARLRLREQVGAPTEWAWLHQVHGVEVREAVVGGPQGEGDAMFTRDPGITLVVGTADCFPVIFVGDAGVGIAHAGWRGAADGVVGALRIRMEEAGIEVMGAAIGPGIGPCCFEVGEEVAERFQGFRSVTTWGTTSVDLPGAIAAALDGVPVVTTGVCTRTDPRFHSHRRDATERRQVALAWLTG
jgi:polyphenol oxidase